MMFNRVVLVGNLTRDIELRYLPSGSALAKSAIATSYKYKTSTGEQKDEVCFLDFNMFGRSAEVANQYLKKGSKVLLEGRLVFEQWQNDQGQNRSKHSIRVDTMKMLGGKNESEQAQPQPQQKTVGTYNFETPETDTEQDEIPF
jgi:single-strand DNA-binding protein